MSNLTVTKGVCHEHCVNIKINDNSSSVWASYSGYTETARVECDICCTVVDTAQTTPGTMGWNRIVGRAIDHAFSHMGK